LSIMNHKGDYCFIDIACIVEINHFSEDFNCLLSFSVTIVAFKIKVKSVLPEVLKENL